MPLWIPRRRWSPVRRTLLCLMLAVLGAGGVVATVSEPVAAAPFPPNIHGRTICARAFVQGTGWQTWRCASRGGALYVGTTGRSRRLEAISVWTAGTGGVCLAGHVQRIGWTAPRCAPDRGQV